MTQTTDNLFLNAAIYDEDESAFTIWDIWLMMGGLSELPVFKEFVWLDQRSHENAYMACTIVWRINQICRLYQQKPTQSMMLEYIDWATKEMNPRYVIGKWWLTRFGANSARKKWNIDNPTKNVSFVTGIVWDEIFWEAYNKNYMIGLTYKWNAAYNQDFSKDWVLDWKDFKPDSYWHTNNAIQCRAVSWSVWIFDNYDSRLKFNKYSIKHMKELVDNGVFYPTYYLMIPTEILENTPEEIKKKKMNDKALNSALYILSSAYDSCTDAQAQKAMATAAWEIRKSLGVEKDLADMLTKSRQALSYCLSYLWNFVDDVDLQKDISELARKIRIKYKVK